MNPQNTLIERNQKQITIEIFRKGKSMGTENRLVAVWGSGQRRTRKDYKPTRERFCGDGRVLKLDCGDACTTL